LAAAIQTAYEILTSNTTCINDLLKCFVANLLSILCVFPEVR